MEDKSLMTKGIVAAVLSFNITIVGIILGFVTLSGVKKYLAAGGEQTGKIKTASILAKVAIGVGIGFTVFYIIYFAIIGAAAASAISMAG